MRLEDAPLPWKTLAPSDVHVPPCTAVTVLGEGELEVHAQAGLLEFREAPALVLQASRLRARTTARVAELPAEQLSEVFGPQRAVEMVLEESGRLERWRHDQLRRDEDFFADDQGGLVPGPYRFGPYEALGVLMRGPTAHVLPRGLRPVPGLERLSLLVLSKVERCRSLHAASDHKDHGYREVAAFVPCLGPNLVPGFYLPEVYPDAYLPILFGREVYGFTKRMGRVLEHPNGFDLIASGSHRLRVRQLDSKCAPEELNRAMRAFAWISRIARPRLYLRKRILDVQAGARARNRVDEIIALPFSIFQMRASELHAANVEFPDGRWTLPGTAQGAISLQLGFTFEDGKVVRRSRWWRRS